MVYDFRMYTLKPGGTPEYMAAVKELALPIRQKYGVKLAGWYYSDVGELNQVVHIWAYRDYAHMAEAKAQVAADPDWSGKYGPRVRPLIVAQKTYVMLSPDFAPQPQ
jgi:NIPSNAP